MTPETKITKETVALLKKNGWWVYKIHGGSWSRNGIPDLIAVKKGIHIWIELKAPGGELSKLQQVVIDELDEHGAFVIVSSNPMEVLDKAEWFAS